MAAMRWVQEERKAAKRITTRRGGIPRMRLKGRLPLRYSFPAACPSQKRPMVATAPMMKASNWFISRVSMAILL